MAGLGLMNALQSYQQGMQWHQQQQEQERQQRQQALMDEADKAAASVLEQSRGEWAMNGAQGQWAPNDSTMLKAAEARGIAFAKGGDWGNYLKNEAAVQRQRIRLRAGALQRYEQDGDAEALLRAVDPTIFNGRSIVAVEKAGGMPALGSIGREATPAALKFKFNDGSEGQTTPDQLYRMVKSTLADPEAMAQKEIEANFLRTKAMIEAEAKKDIERTKGDEDRKTERIKSDNARGLADIKFGYEKTLQDGRLASDERIASGRNATSVRVAGIGADGTVRAAQIRADASLKGADGGGGGKKLHAVRENDDGTVSAVLQDSNGASTVRLLDESGRPLKSASWGKRVDELAKDMIDYTDPLGLGPKELARVKSLPFQERRKLAEQALLGSTGAPAAPPRPAPPPPAPGLGSVGAPAPAVDFSHLWKK